MEQEKQFKKKNNNQPDKTIKIQEGELSRDEDDEAQELSYILLNLRQPPYPPSLSQAYNNKKIKSNASIEYTLTNVKQYYEYGPGITLYFALLRYLIISFIAISIVSIPMMVQNSKGDGLKMYYQGQNYKYDFMKFSLANQNFFQFPTNQWMQSDNDRIEKVRDRQIQIIVTDAIISIMIGFLLIYWNSHVKNIVKSLIQRQDKTLPSYYTVKMKNLQFLFIQQPQQVNKMLDNKFIDFRNIETIERLYKDKILTFLEEITKIYQDNIKSQRSCNYQIVQNQSVNINYNRVRIEFVYNFEDFLQKIKQFTELVQMQNQERVVQEKQKLYQQVKTQYQKLKKIYIKKSKIIIQSFQNYSKVGPFAPVKAFITCSTIQEKNLLLESFNFFISSQIKMQSPRFTNPLKVNKYNRSRKQIKSTIPVLQTCQVEPANILWQNYHLQDQFDLNKKIKICCILTLVLCLALLLIFFINISMASLISTPLQFSEYKDTKQYKQNPNPSYHDAITSNSSVVIYIFCSKLTTKTFHWQYYELCSDYFTNFKQNVGKMITMSFVVFIINFIINKFIYWLAQKRKYRTLIQKQRFVIFNIFVATLINSGLLILLVRAQFADKQNSYNKSADSISLLAFFRLIFPNFFINNHIELYEQFNRRWYIHMGRQLIFNYIVSLILAPWLILLYKVIKTKVKNIKATRFKCETQKKMNKLLQFSQFQLQSFYAITLVSVFFCLCYSSSMPIFYILAILSLTSIFFSSKIVFKYYSKKPIHLFDHLLNSRISRWLILSLFFHQLFSIFFIFDQDIFPQKIFVNQKGQDTIQHARSYVFQIFIYIFLMFMTVLVFFYYERISDVLNQSQKELQQQIDQNKIQEFASYNRSSFEANKNIESNKNISSDLQQQNASKLSDSSRKKRKRKSKKLQKQIKKDKDKQIEFSCKQSQNRLNINYDAIQTDNNKNGNKVKSVIQIKKNENKNEYNDKNITLTPSHYLRSYRMQDNKEYHQISYTLMILNKLIIKNEKLPKIKTQEKKQQLINETHEIQISTEKEQQPIQMKLQKQMPFFI